MTNISGFSAASELSSIHTSAKEVTRKDYPSFRQYSISIHTSAKEVTTISRWLKASGVFQSHFRKGSDVITSITSVYSSNFNPHFRKGSDPMMAHGVRGYDISIHTSAKGSDSKYFTKYLPIFIKYLQIYLNTLMHIITTILYM